MNQFSKFLGNLFESGELILEEPRSLTPGELGSGVAVIETHEEQYRAQLPFAPPVVCSEAIGWAAQSFYRAAQFIVYREIGADQIANTFDVIDKQVNLDASSPSVHYSVDLLFRFLPDLLKFGGSANRDDPTCHAIRRWAKQWPLSSVGMDFKRDILKDEPAGHEDLAKQDREIIFDLDAIQRHPCLFQMYVDRILQTGDQTRVESPVVVAKLKQAIGLYPELAGEIHVGIETE